MYLHQAARARLARSTALAHERQRVTFEPQATPAQQTESQDSGAITKIEPVRHVSLGFSVDVETGEVVEGVMAKRQSHGDEHFRDCQSPKKIRGKKGTCFIIR
jgi:hypothetical protein